MWSSLFGRSASKQKQVPPPPSVEHPQSNFSVPSNPSNYNLNLSPPTMSCSYCCSSKTQNKLMPHKFAVNNNALKDQAPLFPENHHLSTPKRREKQNVIFQHHDQNQHADLSPLAMEHPVAFDDEEEESYYLTMHPLNNVKFRAPQSILLAQPNQMALNISINRGETRHYISNLDTTSLCDCFSYSLKRASHVESVENKALTETPSHSAHVTEPAVAVDDGDAFDLELDLEIDRELGQVYDQNTNTFCHCVTVPIQHRTFKLFRIDLLFDPREYAQIVQIANPSSPSHDQSVSEKLVAINVLLHDHESRIWSGVQTATIQQKNGFLLIPRLSLQCNQTLINKSVNIVGSMAWRISDEATNHEADQLPKWYPYRQYTISQMIAVLTQQRFDIVDSYDAVIQQRKDSKDLKDDNTEKVDDAEINRKSNALNQVVPKRSNRSKEVKGSKQSEPQIAASPEALDPDHIFSDKDKREQRPLTEPEKQEVLDPDMMSPVQRPQRLYPVQSDGGSNIPTKRDQKELMDQPQGQQQEADQQEEQQRGQRENALLTTASSSKHPGILVEEMEKHMLNEEVARIESMIMGLETAMAAIEENDNVLLDRHCFDELTESVCSSMMFSTKELNRARSKITDHLNREHEDNEVMSLIPQRLERERNEVKDTPVLNIRRTTLRTVPVCLSCQRCSRTIMLCQRNQ